MRKDGHGEVTLPTGETVYSDTVVEATACLYCKCTTRKDGRPRAFYSYDDGHRPYCNIGCYLEHCRAVAEKLLRLSPAGLKRVLVRHGLDPDLALCALILDDLRKVPAAKEKSGETRGPRRTKRRKTAKKKSLNPHKGTTAQAAPRRTARKAPARSFTAVPAMV